MSIECENFETSNTGFNYVTYILKDKTQYKMILENIQKSEDWQSNGSDTRAKMYIYYKSGKIDTFCFCPTTAFYYHGKHKLLKDRTLINFLDSLPYKR